MQYTVILLLMSITTLIKFEVTLLTRRMAGGCCPLCHCVCQSIELQPEWYQAVIFLPRCMQCRRGLAMRILSVCPSDYVLSICSVCWRIVFKTAFCWEWRFEFFLKYSYTLCIASVLIWFTNEKDNTQETF